MNEALAVNCETGQTSRLIMLTLVPHTFVRLTFSKPFITSNTLVAISSFVRPAAAEKAVCWGSYVRLGIATVEAETRFHADIV